MSTKSSTTPTLAGPREPRETGPARFQRIPAPPAERPRVLVSIGAALALLALVVGVPAALIALGGVPHLPTSLPSREQLTATIGVEQLLAVLVWVVWLAWLQFTVCVVVELRSALSGVGLPRVVPLGGPSQRIARTLVASVLLLVTAAGQATAVTQTDWTGAQTAASATSTVSTLDGAAAGPRTESTGGGATGGATGGAVGASAVPAAPAQAVAPVEVTYQLGDLQLDAEDGAALVGKKVYVVQPPEGRYHDNLWDIAERTLGDGRRYAEIFELNKDREQPDGHELSLARLIYPNWLLVVPEDAVGAERVTAVTPVAAPAPETPVTPVPADTVTEAVDAAAGTHAAPEAADTAGDAGADAGAGAGVRSLVGAGLLAAGLLAAVEGLRRRRRTDEPSDDAVELEVALRVGADPERAQRLDRALRQLAATLRDTGRDLPGAYAAVIGDTDLTLHLAPAQTPAPAPWRAEEDGRRWVLDAGDVDPAPRAVLAPYPGLVSVGRDDTGADVLLDLEAAQGPVAVVGDPVVALEVATALAAELATNGWSDHLRVTGVDLPAGLTTLDPERYRAVPSLDAVLPELQHRRADSLGAGVLTGRLRGSGASAWMPEYVVLGSTPSPETAARLAELAATDQRSPLGVVCAGDLPGARWHLEVDDAGSLTVRLLDVQVRANRLGQAQVAALAQLLTAAPAPDHGSAGPVGAADDPRAAAVHEGLGERPPVTAPDRPVDPADLAAAPVRVQVLGAPRVHAPTELPQERVALATELVVHLALHPEGVHPTVLAGALWPRGVTAGVREAAVARTRNWLGTAADGTPHLRQDADGRLLLGDGVVLDWDVVRTLLAHARTAPTAAAERRDLGDALRLARSAVLADRPGGRYSWLARVRLERSSRDALVDAAHRLAILCWGDDDPAGAREAAQAGLRVAPTEELLWRDLLRATAATGGRAGVHDVAVDLERTLHAAGIPDVAPPTSALLGELLPSSAPADGVATETGSPA